MTMIHSEANISDFVLVADGATIILRFKHRFIVVVRQSIRGEARHTEV